MLSLSYISLKIKKVKLGFFHSPLVPLSLSVPLKRFAELPVPFPRAGSSARPDPLSGLGRPDRRPAPYHRGSPPKVTRASPGRQVQGVGHLVL